METADGWVLDNMRGEVARVDAPTREIAYYASQYVEETNKRMVVELKIKDKRDAK